MQRAFPMRGCAIVCAAKRPTGAILREALREDVRHELTVEEGYDRRDDEDVNGRRPASDHRHSGSLQRTSNSRPPSMKRPPPAHKGRIPNPQTLITPVAPC